MTSERDPAEVNPSMSQGTTPGQTGSIRCPQCGGPIFFTFAGGPHQLTCPGCKRLVRAEVVHDGKKWRAKILG